MWINVYWYDVWTSQCVMSVMDMSQYLIMDMSQYLIIVWFMSHWLIIVWLMSQFCYNVIHKSFFYKCVFHGSMYFIVWFISVSFVMHESMSDEGVTWVSIFSTMRYMSQHLIVVWFMSKFSNLFTFAFIYIYTFHSCLQTKQFSFSHFKILVTEHCD